jgi:micrococcal nuclease
VGEALPAFLVVATGLSAMTEDIKPSYVYRAKCVSVYDGDTMTVDLDLGFGVWMKKQKLRLFGINAPEMRGEEKERGKISRDAVRGMAPEGCELVVSTHKDKKGKYGRWLASVYCTSKSNPDGPMMCINDALVSRGLAVKALY